MAQTDPLESAIYRELARVGLCSLDELGALLSGYTKAEITAAVDRLTQKGTVAFRLPDPARLILWLPPGYSTCRHLSPFSHSDRTYLTEPVSTSPY